MIEVKNIEKIYSRGDGTPVPALTGVSFDIAAGEFVTIRGKSGSGKSSLMRTIASLQEPSSGTLSFNGIDIVSKPQYVRENLGYLPQEFGVYTKISA